MGADIEAVCPKELNNPAPAIIEPIFEENESKYILKNMYGKPPELFLSSRCGGASVMVLSIVTSWEDPTDTKKVTRKQKNVRETNAPRVLFQLLQHIICVSASRGHQI